jgi:hypothetical protein
MAYIITRPPSTASTWPVMNAASSEQRSAAGVGDLLRRREAADRRARCDLGLERFRQVLGQLRQDEARATALQVMPRAG